MSLGEPAGRREALIREFNATIRAFLGEKPEDPVERVLRAFPGSVIMPRAGYAHWYHRKPSPAPSTTG